MTAKLLEALPRCAVFELQTDTCYRSPAPFTVVANGMDYGPFETNCFTLFDLQPDNLYKVRVEMENEVADIFFRTPPERAFLPVIDFGARGDGETDCTGAIQAAISCCPEGGTVYVPPGVYLTYPLFLRSNTTLYLAEGATLRAGTDRSRYPILPGMVPDEGEQKEWNFGTWEGNPLDCFASLLTAIGARHVTVCGAGTLDGDAQHSDWWIDEKKRRGAWRPCMVFLNHCQDVRLIGLQIKNSPSWTVHPYYSSRVALLDLYIENPSDSPNTDGIDPESCENVRILGSHISVGDDCIAVKSGKYYMAQYHPAPARDIIIRNCLLERGHGAVVVGSEISAGVENLVIERCLLRGTDRGLRVKTRRGRGQKSVLNGIICRNLVMEDVCTPFVINMFYFCDPDGRSAYVSTKEPLPIDNMTPTVGDITLRDIECTGCSIAGIFFYGLPEKPIGQVWLENVHIAFRAGAEEGIPAMMDGIAPMRRVGVFAANVEALTFKRVRIDGYEGEKFRLSGVEHMEGADE